MFFWNSKWKRTSHQAKHLVSLINGWMTCSISFTNFIHYQKMGLRDEWAQGLNPLCHHFMFSFDWSRSKSIYRFCISCSVLTNLFSFMMISSLPLIKPQRTGASFLMVIIGGKLVVGESKENELIALIKVIACAACDDLFNFVLGIKLKGMFKVVASQLWGFQLENWD